MQVHPIAMQARGYGPDHPIDHDVNIARVPQLLRDLASAAIENGDLSTYTALDGTFWVSRVQLAVVAGFGRKLYDKTSPFYVPPEAMMALPYLRQPVTDAVADACDYQHWVRERARAAAAYLAAIRAAMPPRPYDIHVHEAARATSPLAHLAASGQVRSHASDCGCWLSCDEVAEHLPEGERIDDPHSPWFVKMNDRADHAEIDRLSLEHRCCWPELYDAALAAGRPGPPLPPASQVSLTA